MVCWHFRELVFFLFFYFTFSVLELATFQFYLAVVLF